MCIRDRYKIGYEQVMRKMAIGLAEEGYTVEKIAMGMAVSYTHLDVYKRQG